MSVTVDLTSQEIIQLKQLTQTTGDSEAIRLAVREFLRLGRMRELKNISGKVDFEDRSEELESLELSESPFPN